MSQYVIKEGVNIYVRQVKGFTPPNSIGAVPANIAKEDWPYLLAVESADEFGNPVWSFSVDAAAKATANTAKTKIAGIDTSYKSMLTDVYDQLFEVFRTRKPEVATVEHETWKDMVLTPAAYASLGLKVDYQLNLANGPELFSPGSALDTDQKITDYATRKLEQVKAYGPYRAQRKQQFYNEKETIENT